MATPTDQPARSFDIKIAKDADEAEVQAMRFGTTPVDAGIADEAIADAMDDFRANDPLQNERFMEQATTLDEASSHLLHELQRRRSTLGDAYPFSLNRNVLSYVGSRSLVYEFCLITSVAPITSTGFTTLPVIFERVARDIAAAFFGSGAEKYRTGWPPDADRPNRFKAMAQQLHELTGEWHWHPKNGRPDDPLPKDVKEEGVDFVLWKKAGDGRIGLFQVLGQCKCGDSWWHDASLRDLCIDDLNNRWFSPVSHAGVYRVYCIPYHIRNESTLSEVNRIGGLAFDRARLALHASTAVDAGQISTAVRAQMIEGIQLVLQDFQAPAPTA